MTAPPHLTMLTIRNFGCCKDVSLRPLTPLHALIGPNDSGKSTVLRALEISAVLATNPSGHNQAFTDPRLLRGAGESTTRFTLAAGTDTIDFEGGVIQVLGAAEHPALHTLLSGVRLFRLEADALREPGTLIPRDAPLTFTSPRGHGLPSLLDALLSRDPRAFIKLSEQATKLFPSLKQLSLDNTKDNRKVPAAELRDGTKIGPAEMSEGLLYFLAFALLPHVFSGGLLLVEEPENGLHPTRVAEVMRVLREVSKRMQVILTTHSPLVINELEGDEVTLLTRESEAGTKATRLSDTFEYAARARFYSNGELWLSHCDGDREQALFSAGDLPH